MNTMTTTTLYETFESPIGELLAVGDGEALSGLFMQDGRRPVTALADWERDPEPFGRLRAQLDEYFTGARREFDLALAPRGSEFQLRVWEALREIPYGETESYGELAARIGRPGQRPRRRRRQRAEPDRGGRPLPPGHRRERIAHRLRRRARAQAAAPRPRVALAPVRSRCSTSGPAAGTTLALLELLLRPANAAVPGRLCFASSTEQMNSLRARG